MVPQELESLLEERGRQLVAKDAQLEQARAAASASSQALSDLRNQLEREEEAGKGKGTGAEAEIQALRQRVQELEEKVREGCNTVTWRLLYSTAMADGEGKKRSLDLKPGSQLPALHVP